MDDETTPDTPPKPKPADLVLFEYPAHLPIMTVEEYRQRILKRVEERKALREREAH
jgi:hypothetical protein